MDVRCFGGLSVSLDGMELDLGRPKQRFLLAVLSLEADRVVPTERLLTLLWGDDTGQSERSALQAYVSNLRRVLGRGDLADGRRLVVHQSLGYRLAVERSCVDALSFEEHVGRGLRDVRVGDGIAGAAALERALDSWRGDPLPEFQDEPVVFAACERWRGLRGSAVEELARFHLDSDRPELAAVLTEDALAEYPFREGLHRVAALAMYRLGRQSEALGVLGGLRAGLRESAGLDPAPETTDLEQKILAHDAVIGGPGRRSPSQVTEVAAGQRPPRRDPLFGRIEELDLLRAAVELPGSVAVLGAAGAGKTALVTAVVEGIPTSVTVCRVRCPEFGAVPYWPVVNTLQQLQDTLSGTESIEFAGGDAFVIAQGFLRALSHLERRAVLVVDDVQWADVDTLRVLVHLVAGLDASAVTLVLVGRTAEARESVELAMLRAEMTRAGTVTLELGALDGNAIAAWLQNRLPSVEPSVADDVLGRTGGNALFARELIELIARHPEADPNELLRAIPPGVRAVVRHRVGQLPATTQRLLRVASILAPTIDAAVVADIAGLAPSDALHQLDPAVSAGILSTGSIPGMLAFSHDIVAEALSTELRPGRAAELHAGAARSIARRRPDDASAALVAFHATAGVVAGTGPLAVETATRAARAAERRGAFAEAARLCDCAVTVQRQMLPYDAAGLLRALLDAARAHERGDEMALAVNGVREALQLALELDDRDGLGEAAGVLGHTSVFPNQPYGVVDRELVVLLEAALERLDRQPEARVSVLCALVTELFHSADSERRHRYAITAVEEARRLCEPSFVVRALQAATFDLKAPADVTARLEVATEMVEVAVEHDMDDDVVLLANLQVSLCDLALGRFDAVAHRLRVCRQLTERPVGGALRSQVAFLGSHLELITGQLHAAQTSGDAAHELLRRSRPLEASGMRLAQELSIAHELGHVDELLGDVRQIPVGAHGYGSALRLLAAVVLAEGGRQDEAVDIATYALVPPDDDAGDYLTLFQDAARAFVVSGTGDRNAALRLHGRLRPFRGHWVSAGTVGGSLGFIDLALARLDQTLGREVDARSGFDDAVRLHRQAGATTWLGWTLLHRGRFLHDAGETDGARAALDEAAAIARSIGSSALTEQVRRPLQ